MLNCKIILSLITQFCVHRILEYLSREDADRAVKDLDGKDLRGRPVRVAFDDSVSVCPGGLKCVLCDLLAIRSG